MDAMLLFVHSPLVGPSSWLNVEREARARDIWAITPDLTSFANQPRPRWGHYVDLAASAANGVESVIAVGHSGAGALLPLIASRLGDRLAAAVLVDAIMPGDGDRHEVSNEIASLLDTQTTAGHLAPWLDWWPASVIEDLLPSAADRDLLASDMPALPQDTYNDAVELPENWSRLPGAYLQLSAAYAADKGRAIQHDWPVRTLDSTHLGLITQPANVLEMTLDLAAEAWRTRHA